MAVWHALEGDRPGLVPHAVAIPLGQVRPGVRRPSLVVADVAVWGIGRADVGVEEGSCAGSRQPRFTPGL